MYVLFEGIIMMNHTQSTLLVVLCTIAPLCWSAEQTLTEKLQSAVHSGGQNTLYRSKKHRARYFS